MMDRSASGSLGERSGSSWAAQQGPLLGPLAGALGGPVFAPPRPSRLGFTMQDSDAAMTAGAASMSSMAASFPAGMPPHARTSGYAVTSPPLPASTGAWRSQTVSLTCQDPGIAYHTCSAVRICLAVGPFCWNSIMQ